MVLETERKKVVFLGSKELGMAVLTALSRSVLGTADLVIMNFDDRSDERSVYSDIGSFQNSAAQYYSVSGRKDAEDLLARVNPHLTVVCGWYYLLDKDLLSSLRGPIIGLHGSLLPKNRGFAPIVWSMINGDPFLGYSVFDIVEEMDAGDIYYQFSLKNETHLTIGDVLDCFKMDVLENLGSIFAKILSGEIVPKIQDHAAATFGKRRTAEDGRIDWRQSAQKVNDFIRAQSAPYPGAYAMYGEHRITIEKSLLLDCSSFSVSCEGEIVAGKVVAYGENGALIVCCGDNNFLSIELIKDQKNYKLPSDLIGGIFNSKNFIFS